MSDEFIYSLLQQRETVKSLVGVGMEVWGQGLWEGLEKMMVDRVECFADFRRQPSL